LNAGPGSREAHSTKILFQVRHRFWEDEDGIVGGATVTDLPIRRMNYPPSSTDTTRGVLLASYTWGQDALQWGAMDPETRLEEALGFRGRWRAGFARRQKCTKPAPVLLGQTYHRKL